MKPEPFTSRLFSIGALLGGFGFLSIFVWAVVSTFKIPFFGLYNQFGGLLGGAFILLAFAFAIADSFIFRNRMRKASTLVNHVPNTKFVDGRFVTVSDAETADDRSWNEQISELGKEVDSPLFLEWCKLPAKSSE